MKKIETKLSIVIKKRKLVSLSRDRLSLNLEGAEWLS
jgi:hypothetical protein